MAIKIVTFQLRLLRRREIMKTLTKSVDPKASFTLQAEPSRAEPGRTSDYSHCKPSRPEMKAVQLTFLNCEDVKPSACIFINGQYLVEKPLIY